MDPLTRRDLLGRAGNVALAGAAAAYLPGLAGCGGNGSDAPDFRLLDRTLRGTVVLPDDPRYRRLWRPFYYGRFKPRRPQAIALCDGADDVSGAIGFAREHELPFAARNGGHSFAGYSTTDGLLIDVSRMHRVTADSGGTATVGSGATLLWLAHELWRQQRAMLPHGDCPTVGVSGQTLAGGFGLGSRLYGLMCDNLKSIEIVTADGRVLTCDASRNADLFWACRGGGGGNFGIVTSLEFGIHPVDRVTTFVLEWPWSAATELTRMFQQLVLHAPARLFPVLKLQRAETSGSATRSSAVLEGDYFGPRSELFDLLDPLLGGAFPSPRATAIQTKSYWDSVLQWAGVIERYLAARAGSRRRAAREVILPPQRLMAKFGFIDEPIPEAGIETMVDRLSRAPGNSSSEGAAIQLNAFNGAIGRVPATSTAFVHRSSLLFAEYKANLRRSDSELTARRNLDWVTGVHAAMAPYASPQSYQGFLDPTVKDWENVYYGENFSRLVAIKRKYDPDDVFRFPQSIPL